jgi:hypothetical protein
METELAGTEVKPTAAAPAPEKTAEEGKTLLGTDTKEQSGQPEQKPAKADEKPTVPAVFELKAPEGSTLNAKHIEGLVEFAKANGLTPAAAQKALERDVAILAAHSEANVKDWYERQVPAFQKEIKDDKEIGGGKYAETDRLATLAISRFGPPGMLKQLQDSGFAYEPSFVRLMRNVGAALSEPGRLEGGVAPSQGQDKLKNLYNNPTSQTLFVNAG